MCVYVLFSGIFAAGAAKLKLSLVVVTLESVQRNAAKVYKQIIFTHKKEREKMMKLAYEHRRVN